MPIVFHVGDRVQVSNAREAIALDGVPTTVSDGDQGVVTQVDFAPEDSWVQVCLDTSGREWWFDGSRLALVDDSDAVDTDVVSLNLGDPFERVIADMVETNRRKRSDYAIDGSPWSNFDDVANSLGIDGFTPVDSANFNIEQKSARLRSLRKNGRMDDPANESVADTYLDRAVYSVIALAMHRYPTGKVDG